MFYHSNKNRILRLHKIVLTLFTFCSTDILSTRDNYKIRHKTIFRSTRESLDEIQN